VNETPDGFLSLFLPFRHCSLSADSLTSLKKQIRLMADLLFLLFSLS